MRPILPGHRGPAVEDIQRRLHVLGYDLGQTGVDGVFLGMTRDAVISFQRTHDLSEDGVVGDETWSALVDATFTLGNRVLYLRLPYFHGNDVRVLQQAVGALGFPVGPADGIFGPGTERAIREFQRNAGQTADGIVGADTVRVIERLHHVWEGRAASTHVRSGDGTKDRARVFRRTSVELIAADDVALGVASRIVNVALATNPDARISLAQEGGAADVTLRLSSATDPSFTGPIVTLGEEDAGALSGRIITALSARGPGCSEIAIDLRGAAEDDHGMQSVSVRVFDALCLALAE